MVRVNRRGITRIVLVFKNVVVKIPNFRGQWDHFLRGILSNISESRTYRYAQIPDSYGYEGRHNLCPVLWMSWGGWMLVMKRADIAIPIERISELVKRMDEVKKLFPGDDKAANYGIVDNVIVKIDYGELDRPASGYNKENF